MAVIREQQDGADCESPFGSCLAWGPCAPLCLHEWMSLQGEALEWRRPYSEEEVMPKIQKHKMNRACLETEVDLR